MIRLTSLSASNLDGVVSVERTCFSHPWSRNAFLADISNPNAVYFCLEDNETVIGYIGMWNIGGEGNITNIAVLPQYRRQGHARHLLETMISYAKEEKLLFLTLEVRESNEGAICLYRSLGFTEVGRRKKYYEHTEDAILMTLSF